MAELLLDEMIRKWRFGEDHHVVVEDGVEIMTTDCDKEEEESPKAAPYSLRQITTICLCKTCTTYCSVYWQLNIFLGRACAGGRMIDVMIMIRIRLDLFVRC